MELNGSVVVVAGGAGSLGAAIVAAAAARGARTIAVDRSASAGDADLALATDLADEQDVAAAVERIVTDFGAVDVLVNAAGLIRSEPLVNILAKEDRRHRRSTWDDVLRSNLTATFVMSAHVVEQMIAARNGVIVNFSSVTAAGNPGQTAYAAAKAGVEALTAVWARELGPLGVRVVAIAPGFVDTPSTTAALSESGLKEWRRRTPLRRLAEAREIVSAVLFAIENDFVTGRTLAIDGGLSI